MNTRTLKSETRRTIGSRERQEGTPPLSRRSQRGFTLIELLIVVAIIAILAAIAVPNFLEAQTRSKISRVRSDLRALATAIESYAVDHTSLPLPSGSFIALCFMLSTPVAYIASTDMNDPFTPPPEHGWPLKSYVYHTYSEKWNSSWKPPTPPGGSGPWYQEGFIISSTGPNRIWDVVDQWPFHYNFPTAPLSIYAPSATDYMSMVYDATNGTKSGGDIFRIGGDLPAPQSE